MSKETIVRYKCDLCQKEHNPSEMFAFNTDKEGFLYRSQDPHEISMYHVCSPCGHTVTHRVGPNMAAKKSD